MDLFKEISNLIDDTLSELQDQLASDAINDLANAIEDDVAFTAVANALFKSNNVLDSDGNIVKVDNPADAIRNIVIVNGSGNLVLTEAEDRWLRANKIYGKDILSLMGFKYTDI